MPEKELNGLSRAPSQSELGVLPWQLLLSLISALVLFGALGGAALFEPDEGRNSEKAREILVLNDWITPHQNFLPTLDKPMFFYWLVALSFKLLGFTEWAARLPSALAAIGCLFLVYRFARDYWGVWEALWSCLILVSCLQFVIFSRLVIFDMTLTFFISWALLSFFRIADYRREVPGQSHVIGFYVSMALGTIVKGPIALIAPGMVVLVFLALSRRWALLRSINLPLGALLYSAIVAPWYVAVELKNPGYLRYFLWDEHFMRYFTPRFGRSKSWYYFFIVVGVGFLPWTLSLLASVKQTWRDKREPATLFLILWAVLPFVFFSLSNSKLPHYILPIYPALALLVGRVLAAASAARHSRWFALWTPLLFALSCSIYLLLGVFAPKILAVQIRDGVAANAPLIAAGTLMLLVIIATSFCARAKEKWHGHGLPFLSSAVGMALFVVVLTQTIAAAKFNRVSKPLSQAAAPHFSGREQLVFYDTYLEGVPFYLRIDRPAWLVQARGRTSVMASNYLAARRPAPAAGYGRVVLSFEEFAEQWKGGQGRLLVIIKGKNLPRLAQEIGSAPIELARYDEYRLVSNR